jgi:hypothetical protein
VTLRRTVVLGSLGWLAVISGLHAWLNLGVFRERVSASRLLKVGYLPVT